MNEVFFIAGDYLKGKSIYPAFRRILNLLLNISISSFIYEKCYGVYSWLNYNDYKGILTFFIKGNFFIPLSIFIVVYCLSQFLPITIFSIINHIESNKLTREILLFKIKKETIDQRIKDITKYSKFASPVKLTKEKIIDVYVELRKEIKHEAFLELEKELIIPKQNLEANFILAFRILIAITIYYFSLPIFGFKLYAIALVVLVCVMFIIMIAYRILEITPTLMRKSHQEAEEYLKVYLEKNNSIDESSSKFIYDK